MNQQPVRTWRVKPLVFLKQLPTFSTPCGFEDAIFLTPSFQQIANELKIKIECFSGGWSKRRKEMAGFWIIVGENIYTRV